MKKIGKAKIMTVTLMAAGFLSLGSIAFGAGVSEESGVVSYKFRMLRDKIAALSVNEPENLKIVKPAQAATATVENLIINNENGVKVIKNDIEKAGSEIENMKKSGPGKVDISVDDRVRWEHTGFKATGGKNLNRSAVTNRTRVNVKMNLSEKTTADFSAQKTNDLGTGAQNMNEPAVNKASITVDLDK